MDCDKSMEGTIFDYEAFTLDGKEKILFRQFAGKYVLFVNVATYCALTDQYPGKIPKPCVFGTKITS